MDVSGRTHAFIEHPWVHALRSRVGVQSGAMLVLAAAVGFLTGLLAVALLQTILVMQRLSFGTSPSWITTVVVTTFGGLLVGLIVTYVIPEARGGGVTRVMESIALHGGRVRARVIPGKLIATGLSVGAGASGGREGPIVQIGGALGSLLGRVFALTEDQKRELIAAGAAAGIAASFNAPIGGMLFAIEVILGGFKMRYLQVIVVASVVASVTARELVGESLIYNPPAYSFGAPSELLLYALLGFAAAGIGLLLSRGEHWSTKFFERLPIWTPAKTMIGGFGVGMLALAVPEVVGTGDHLPPIGGITEPIAAFLGGEFAATYGYTGFAAAAFVLFVVALKLLATLLSLGSGFSVGSFAPTLFLGAGLGAAIGHAAGALVPTIEVAPGALALVGMAAVMGASARAPLTGMILIFELTGDYGLVLPLMLATGIATVTADRIDRESIYSLPLRQRGIVYQEPQDIDMMQLVRVGEIMTRNPQVISESGSLQALDARFAAYGAHGFPVVSDTDPTLLVGVVTVSDLTRAVDNDPTASLANQTVGQIMTRQPLTVTPDDPVYRAVQRMGAIEVGRIPVVSPEDHRRLVGMVRRADIVSAYQQALALTVESQQRGVVGPLRDLTGTRSVELAVDAGSAVVGQQIRDISWPPNTIVASIRRGTEVVTPSGNTTIFAGDRILAITGMGEAEMLRDLLAENIQTDS